MAGEVVVAGTMNLAIRDNFNFLATFLSTGTLGTNSILYGSGTAAIGALATGSDKQRLEAWATASGGMRWFTQILGTGSATATAAGGETLGTARMTDLGLTEKVYIVGQIVNTAANPTTLGIRIYVSNGTATAQDFVLARLGDVAATSQLTFEGFVGAGPNGTVYVSQIHAYSGSLVATSSGTAITHQGYGTIGSAYTSTWNLVINQNGFSGSAGSILFSWNVQRMRA